METRAVRSIEEAQEEELPICGESVVANEKGEIIAKLYKLC